MLTLCFEGERARLGYGTHRNEIERSNLAEVDQQHDDLPRQEWSPTRHIKQSLPRLTHANLASKFNKTTIFGAHFMGQYHFF
jgi:hypothetical protein